MTITTTPTEFFKLDYGSKFEREIVKLTEAFEKHNFNPGRYPAAGWRSNCSKPTRTSSPASN